MAGVDDPLLGASVLPTKLTDPAIVPVPANVPEVKVTLPVPVAEPVVFVTLKRSARDRGAARVGVWPLSERGCGPL